MTAHTTTCEQQPDFSFLFYCHMPFIAPCRYSLGYGAALEKLHRMPIRIPAVIVTSFEL